MDTLVKFKINIKSKSIRRENANFTGMIVMENKTHDKYSWLNIMMLSQLYL